MSLRARLLAGLAVVAIVLVGAGSFVAHNTQAQLLAQVDAQLAAAQPRRFSERPVPVSPPPDPRASNSPERLSALYVGVVRDGAVTTIFKPNLIDNPPLPDLLVADVERHAADGAPFTAGSDVAGVRYRVRAVNDTTRGETMVVALSLEDTDRAVRQLIGVEIGVTAGVLALLAAVAWWVIRLGVRPVKQMTETATAIAAGDLSRRVPEVHSLRTEAGQLGDALNRMLNSIEEAFGERTESDQRLRRFIADASHELRTPVATIRGYAELFRAGALEERPQLTDAMRRTEEEAVRMGGLIDDMLHLARLDQGRPLERTPVDLATVAEDVTLDARAVAPDREITVVVERPTVVLGDEDRLRQVASNLVRNALVHTPPGTPVEIRVSGTRDRAVLEISDRGQGMPPEVADRAFERFFRADPARSRHRGGSGLGLSIVQATVVALGGSVGLETQEGQGTTIRVELPRDGGQRAPQSLNGGCRPTDSF
jgi:two-component system OmpR family sensor kinase